MEFLTDYGLFLAKLVTVVFAILAILFSFFSLIAYATKSKIKGRLTVQKLNDKYNDYYYTLAQIVKKKSELKSELKQREKDEKKTAKLKESEKRIFVLNFNGDIRASTVVALCEEVSAILTIATQNDEVLIRLESGGGAVNGYGLAASQLQRIKDANIRLVVAIDKIAASGGYLMACVADHIMAAPFAVVGSIGVLAQLPNFHRFLQKHSVDFEQITAGDYKRTLSLFGENTEKGREKTQQEVEEMHELFKSFVKTHRENLDIEKVATGEHWTALQAINLKLVDELRTSDDYLLAAANQKHSLFEIEYKLKYPLRKRISESINHAYHKLLTHLFL